MESEALLGLSQSLQRCLEDIASVLREIRQEIVLQNVTAQALLTLRKFETGDRATLYLQRQIPLQEGKRLVCDPEEGGAK